MNREALIKGVAVSSEELIAKWQKDLQILEGKKALGITLSAKDKQHHAFLRAFLTVAIDRREQLAA